MSKNLKYLGALVVLLSLFAGVANADLVAHWKFDEGSGTTALDSSGNGNDGTFDGNPVWVTGQLGGALEGNGSSDLVRVPHSGSLDISQAVTVALWLFGGTPPDQPISKGEWNASYGIRLDDAGGRLRQINWRGRGPAAPAPGNSLNSVTALPEGEWVHVAVTFDADASGNNQKIFINGVVDAENRSSTPLSTNTDDVRLFAEGYANTNRFIYGGMLDDIRIYNTALPESEIPVVMKGQSEGIALNPDPEDSADDVPRDVVLNWSSGKFAAQHRVYLGTTFSDVNDMGLDDALTVQDTPSFDLGVLDFGRTYYWRVDEVNGAPDRTVFTGDIWSFMVEPMAIPIETITATASGANPDMGPEKTINGSGLNDMDEHSMSPTDMWLTLTPDSWIQYEFDKAYKLHEMLIWNSNQVIEPFIGFGVKEATIETSLDGENWTAVDGVGELAKAPGAPTYVANNAVAMGGVMAKYVKLTPVSAHGFTGQNGLAEIRFLALPVTPREPQPADGVTTANATIELSWRSGREAVSHDVYLGTDPDALALIDTTTDASLITDPLDYLTTYYWSVTEVNDAAVPAAHAGNLWSFATPEYLIVDDFESYSEKMDEEVFLTWFDGFGGDDTLGGSVTGHIDAPFVEAAIVYDGDQSMPIFIDNDGGFANIDGQVSSPTFSEVVRELDSQDWTVSGIKSLSLVFQGETANTGSGQLYVKINNTRVDYSGDAADLLAGIWVPWIIDLSAVGATLQNVTELTIGVEGAGFVGTVYIDAIRLYPKAIEFITPVAPDTSGQLANYQFDGSVNDSSAGANHGAAIGDPAYAAGLDGQALSLDGVDDYIQIANNDRLALRSTGTFTVSASVNAILTDQLQMVLFHGLGCSSWGSWFMSVGGSEDGEVPDTFVFGMRSGNGGANTRVEAGAVSGEWVDLVATFDGAQLSLFVNGRMADSVAVTDLPYDSAEDLYIGADPGCGGRSFYGGLVDNVVIYDHAMSPGEVAGLAGRTEPIAKPF